MGEAVPEHTGAEGRGRTEAGSAAEAAGPGWGPDDPPPPTG